MLAGTACDPPKPCADGRRMPATAPPFTIGQLRKAVPAHCFERSVSLSSAYLLVDLLAVAGLFTACLHIDGLPMVGIFDTVANILVLPGEPRLW